jgi:hypothetical protein
MRNAVNIIQQKYKGAEQRKSKEVSVKGPLTI